MTTPPPVCDYEGSDYQQTFWDRGGREYEDRAESIALRRLLPDGGRRMLELGAGAGRNTPRYRGFSRIVLLDYSITQLEQARRRLGDGNRYVYVAADVYRLPFRGGLFDAATMIRTLHHMADARRALEQVRAVLGPGAVFILEFANKLNLKSILRYWTGSQEWNPFTPEPVEFARLNFDFHPRSVRRTLHELGFTLERSLTVSHFRVPILKRIFSPRLLAAVDGWLQPSGAWIQLTPSIFLKARVPSGGVPEVEVPESVTDWFKCTECGASKLSHQAGRLLCPGCGARWAVRDGIYDFRSRE